jgi:hypothetical protein
VGGRQCAANEVLVANGDVEDCAAAGDVEPSIHLVSKYSISTVRRAMNSKGVGAHLWQFETKKSGLNVEKSKGMCPTPCAPSIRLNTPSSLHTDVKRSNGIRTPGMLTMVSKMASLTLPPLFLISWTLLLSCSTSQSSSTGYVYPILTDCAGVVSVMYKTDFSIAP